jgi:hypothetical protein
LGAITTGEDKGAQAEEGTGVWVHAETVAINGTINEISMICALRSNWNSSKPLWMNWIQRDQSFGCFTIS